MSRPPSGLGFPWKSLAWRVAVTLGVIGLAWFQLDLVAEAHGGFEEASLAGESYFRKRWHPDVADCSIVLDWLTIGVGALFANVCIWGPLALVARTAQAPALLSRDGVHLVGDVLYELSDHEAVFGAAAREIRDAHQRIGDRAEEVRRLATERRALLARAGRGPDAPLQRMEALAAEQDGLIAQLRDAQSRLDARRLDFDRRVNEVRVQAELVWQTHQLQRIENAAAGQRASVAVAAIDLTDIQQDLARIVEASERASAAWKADGEVSAL
jgi:hypothetical protein